MKDSTIKYRVHAIQRMFERGFIHNEIKDIILNGKVIIEYPEDKPYPSRLILGWIDNRPVHVVTADNEEAKEIIVITVYEPDPLKWDANFERKIKL